MVLMQTQIEFNDELKLTKIKQSSFNLIYYKKVTTSYKCVTIYYIKFAD